MEPIVDASICTQGRQLYLCVSNQIVGADLFVVPALNLEVIADVLDVHFKGLVPHGMFACFVLNVSLVKVFAKVDLAERVHLADVGVVGEFRLNKCES